MMRGHRLRADAGFTLVELTIVVVISTIALVAIYQTLITQERTYRFQSAAIETQGSTRVGLQLLGSELREISASAGADTAKGGSDLLAATRDSVRVRAFRKIGLACNINIAMGNVDVWVPGSTFEAGDTLFIFQEGDTLTDEDDQWASGVPLPRVGAAANAAACTSEWGDYPVQGLQDLSLQTAKLQRGALIRSYHTVSYGAYQYEGDWVIGRRTADGIVPLVGPLLSPDSGGITFRYFDQNGTELTPTTAALRAQVARIEITVRAMHPGGVHGVYVDSLSTHVYLRGN